MSDGERKNQRMVELGRLGGLASQEARRRRRSRTWDVAFLERVDQDPDVFAERLLTSGNGAAIVKGLELAHRAKRARLVEREAELDRRERNVRQAERDHAAFAAWEADADATYEVRMAEIAELERERDALRAAIAAEAETAGYALVEVADARMA